ncbi:MAG: tetratricopeptide repeat protein [Pseudomonadota bacterium]
MKRLASALLISMCTLFSGCGEAAPTNTSRSVSDAEWSMLPMRQLVGKYYSRPLLEFITTVDEQTLSPGDLTIAGYALAMGVGVQTDFQRGIRMLKASCDQGHLRGCALLGYFYLSSESHDLQSEAEPLLTPTCEAGNMWACSTLVTAYTYGIGVDADEARATKYANRACEHPRERICADAALLLRDINKTDSLRLHKKSCDADSAVACLNLAAAYNRRAFDDPAPEEVKNLLDKSCRLGLDNACWGYLHYFTKRQTEHSDPTPYIEASDRICRRGLTDACNALSGFFAAPGENKTYKNEARALEYEVLACGQGDMKACSWAGKWYRDGFGTSPNLDAALNVYRHVCQSGDAKYGESACRSVAELEAVQNPSTGHSDLSLRACELGSSHDCRDLGWMYAMGEGVTADPVRATEFFKIGCERDNAMSCLDLAGLYHWAEYGIEQDLDKALIYYQKSCGLGFEFGCDQLAEFNQNAG